MPPDDPTVHFLTRVQILTDWNRIQEHGSIANVMRFERIKKWRAKPLPDAPLNVLAAGAAA